MKKLKVAIYICFSLLALVLLPIAAFFACTAWEYHLPSEQRVRQEFESHKAEYVRFATLLQKDPATTYIYSNGKVDIDANHARIVPEYRDLIRKIRAQNVRVRYDGSVEFTLFGFGCVICNDSYMGVRFCPENVRPGCSPGWPPKVVSSLESTNLPRYNGHIADGLYVVPIEHEWFIYRFECVE